MSRYSYFPLSSVLNIFLCHSTCCFVTRFFLLTMLWMTFCIIKLSSTTAFWRACIVFHQLGGCLVLLTNSPLLVIGSFLVFQSKNSKFTLVIACCLSWAAVPVCAVRTEFVKTKLDLHSQKNSKYSKFKAD